MLYTPSLLPTADSPVITSPSFRLAGGCVSLGSLLDMRDSGFYKEYYIGGSNRPPEEKLQ